MSYSNEFESASAFRVGSIHLRVLFLLCNLVDQLQLVEFAVFLSLFVICKLDNFKSFDFSGFEASFFVLATQVLERLTLTHYSKNTQMSAI